MSACFPGSSDPVTRPNPATRAPSTVAKRITSRVLISRGSPAFPASLRSKTVACWNEIVARIWANMSPGETRSSSTPRPGRRWRSTSCWIGGDPRPPAISLAGANETDAPAPARASMVVSSRPGPWTSVTSAPRSPRRFDEASEDLPGGGRPAVARHVDGTDEQGAQPGVAMGLESGFREVGPALDVPPGGDGGDAGFDGAEQPDERRRVQIL